MEQPKETTELFARHPWLARLKERDAQELIQAGPRERAERWDTSVWAPDLAAAGCGPEQLRAAMLDPEMRGLYVPDSKGRDDTIGWGVASLVRQLCKDWFLGEEAPADIYAEFNNRYTVVKNLGGKCRVVSYGHDGQIVAQDFTNFQQAHCNRYVVTTVEGPKGPKEVRTPAGKFWLESPLRKQVETARFAPGQQLPDNVLNLWLGWGVKPKERWGKVDSFLQYMMDVLCDGDEQAYDYLLRWMAYAVQFPDRPGETVVVLRSAQEGTGKSFFGEHFGKLFGQHTLQVASERHVTGNFNAHLQTTCLLVLNEALFAGDKKTADTLKALVTERTLPIERKGIDVVNADNCLHIVMTSNHDHVVRAGPFARRFFVLDVNPEWKDDREYFGAIAKDLREGGYGELLKLLLEFKLDGWAPQPVYETTALEEQKAQSADHIADDWAERVQESVSAIVPDGTGVEVHSSCLLKVLLPRREPQPKDFGTLAKAMKSLGYERPKRGTIRVQGAGAKGWRRLPIGDAATVKVWAERLPGNDWDPRLVAEDPMAKVPM